MSLLSKIESILFVASKPLALKTIAKAVGSSSAEVEEAIDVLSSKYNTDASGIHILREGKEVQMATNSDNADVIDGFIKDEVSGELTKAQLETLTVIAYRGPITRPELEQIRGVNCALILRNLLLRGLIEQKENKNKITSVYVLSFGALGQLGITATTELPDYENLHKHDNIEQILLTE